MAVLPTSPDDTSTAQSYADTAANSPMADFGYMAAHPGISTALAHDVGSQIGVDTSQPHNLAAVMHSSTYAQKLDAVKTGKDNRLVQRVLGTTPTAVDPKATGQQQEFGVYAGQEQNVVNNMRANAVMAQRKMEAQQKLSELSDFDAESYKAARLKELNPTSDVDQKILELQMQAIVAKSALRNELRALDPVLRDRALNARLSVFNDAISKLGDIRDARVKTAEGQIANEISSKNQQVRTAKASVDALDSVIASLKDNADAGDTIYKIRLERAKAQKILDKAHGSGVPDQEGNIVNYLLDDLTKRGHTPTASDIANAKRVAKETVAQNKSISDERGSALKGVQASRAIGSGIYDIRLPTDPLQEGNNPDNTIPQ